MSFGIFILLQGNTGGIQRNFYAFLVWERKMQNTRFSIVIPVYNAKDFIAKAIDSAINQSYGNIEIICVDDKSVDNSVSIIKEFMAKDERIKLIYNERNLGTFATRNNGVLNASGEYLLFLDADDYLHKDACQKCHNILRNYTKNKNGERIDFIMFNLLKQNKKGEFMLCKLISKAQIIDDCIFEAMYFGCNNNYFNLAVKCVRKSIFLQAINFANIQRRLVIAEDILTSTAILGVSKKIALLDEALYYYCHNDDSATRNMESNKLQERIENINFVISKFWEFAGKKDKQYKVFVLCLNKILATHIVHNKTQRFVDAYTRRIENGYPKFLARLILSLQRKPFRLKEKECDLRRFVEENKGVFQKFS